MVAPSNPTRVEEIAFQERLWSRSTLRDVTALWHRWWTRGVWLEPVNEDRVVASSLILDKTLKLIDLVCTEDPARRCAEETPVWWSRIRGGQYFPSDLRWNVRPPSPPSVLRNSVYGVCLCVQRRAVCWRAPFTVRDSGSSTFLCSRCGKEPICVLGSLPVSGGFCCLQLRAPPPGRHGWRLALRKDPV